MKMRNFFRPETRFNFPVFSFSQLVVARKITNCVAYFGLLRFVSFRWGERTKMCVKFSREEEVFLVTCRWFGRSSCYIFVFGWCETYLRSRIVAFHCAGQMTRMKKNLNVVPTFTAQRPTELRNDDKSVKVNFATAKKILEDDAKMSSEEVFAKHSTLKWRRSLAICHPSVSILSQLAKRL